jgi:hypothetical protein
MAQRRALDDFVFEIQQFITNVRKVCLAFVADDHTRSTRASSKSTANTLYFNELKRFLLRTTAIIRPFVSQRRQPPCRRTFIAIPRLVSPAQCERD